jgi:AmiR/NasT family two-component response regulator
MYNIVMATEDPLTPDEMRQDLLDAGVNIVAENTDPLQLATAVVRTEPDLVIAASASPSNGLFDAAKMLGTLAPRPFVMFTSDLDANKIDRASSSNIHAYIVNGYAKHRLLSIIEVARARFRHDQVRQEELTGLSKRFEERKIVDRAKGALMRSRGVTEEEAFEILRNLAMNARQRIGVASQGVIDMSRASEAVNRSGQLRMLSQRIVKCCAAVQVGPDTTTSTEIIADCVARVDSNLGILHKAISTKGYGDLVDRVAESWKNVRAIATAPFDRSHIDALDLCAEAMLKDAERLTEFLEASGLAPSLRILNIAGRQRMLSQRIGKLCFLLAIEPSALRATQLTRVTEAFQTGIDFLTGAPLSSKTIRADLEIVLGEWKRLKTLLESMSDPVALARISATSDRLLALSEQLTDLYEQAMQVLIGDRMGRLV